MSFDALSDAAQVHRLRRVAMTALGQYPIEVARFTKLNHGFNTVFRVDTIDGRKFALRINVNSRRTDAFIAAEAAWLAALTAETDLLVPTPQPTMDGALMTKVFFDELDRELPAVLLSWLPGKDLGDDIAPAPLAAIGRAAATLHRHAAAFQLPPGAELPVFDNPLFGDVLNATAEHPLVGADNAAVIADALARCTEAYRATWRSDAARPLHADLHGWNLKWHRGNLAVFDFDDSGIGMPALDLAIATYYLRVENIDDAPFHAGYEKVMPLPDLEADAFEGLIASRNLLLLNDVLVNMTASIRNLAAVYVRNSARRLRHYLKTGRYRFDVDGIEPLP
jgi:Ser/Thr protein kinase RdoA (MazF antagonist)